MGGRQGGGVAHSDRRATRAWHPPRSPHQVYTFARGAVKPANRKYSQVSRELHCTLRAHGSLPHPTPPPPLLMAGAQRLRPSL